MTPDPIRMNRSTYDQIAPRYAQANAEMGDQLSAAAEKLLARLENKPSRILDLGCGAGRDLAWFSAHAAQIVGVDLSRGMLQQARQLSSAPIAQMDMRFLGFPARSFAAVWCVAALLHIPKVSVPLVLAEMARVLEPGGFLYLSVQLGTGEVVEREPYFGTMDRFYNRFKPDELTSLVKGAGLQVMHMHDYEGHRHWLWVFAIK